MPLNVSASLWEHVEFAVSLGSGWSQGLEPLNSALQGSAEERAGCGARSTRHVCQVFRAGCQAEGTAAALPWPYKGAVGLCAGSGSRWRRCWAGPAALPLPRRSPGLPLPHGREVPSAARPDKHRRAFWGEINSPVLLLGLSEAWNKIRTKMFIPGCGVY